MMDNLLPWASQPFVGRPFILQKDWAPFHGAKATKVVLDTHFPGYLGKDLWPTRSPDLNPMDFSVLGLLESKISGSSYNSVDALKAAL
uniref:Tc1-like transposase DDE domain-containing protein n=1 Tax=Caenorhabditis japonica TaxID=281687 RepID=A0A8R1DKC7_CAEJA